ncbi:MAG TPA: FtsX-like permease family protein [Bacteroidales bacterium]|nr:FtsX-like permease family protein [Bacteroidales bacterium]
MYNDVYKNEFQLKNISLSLSILALILSSIGLFGITGMVFETRTKEISIRNVNGARSREILLWLLKEILTVVSLAILLGVPVSWFILKNWLQKFAGRVTPSPSLLSI